MLAGGIWHAKGFKNLFKKKIVETLAHPSFEKLRHLKLLDNMSK